MARAPLRIAVFAAPASSRDHRRLTMLLAHMIQWAGVVAGRNLEAVLGVDEGSADLEAQLVRARSRGIPARVTRWFSPVAGTGDGKAAGELTLAPSDGANEFLDCDLWLLVGARPDIPLVAPRPYGLVVSDCAWRYFPELLDPEMWARLERNGCALFRHAGIVLVNDPRTAVEVQSFAGVRKSAVLELPVALPGSEPSTSRRPCEEDYLLWIPESGCDRPGEVLRELQRYYGELGGQLRTVIAVRCERSDDGTPLNGRRSSASAGIPRHLEDLPDDLRAHVTMLGEWSLNEHLAAIQHARLLLHTKEWQWPGLAPLDAAWFAVPLLAARSAAVLHLERSLHLGATFFDARVPGELASALAEAEHPRPSRLPSRKDLGSFHYLGKALTFVDALVSRLPETVPYAYR